MHKFHIPVMGLGFTIDTPVKVAPYGISSVISIIDHSLIEKMREYYSRKIGIPYSVISEKVKDYRAERITNYLNLIDQLVSEKFAEVKNSIHEKGEEIHKYIEMLPDVSEIKKKFYELIESGSAVKKDIQKWIHDNIRAGSIDVNIMTKVDSENYSGDEKLPVEFNDAHAALRGFANSKLNSSLVLSAGMNPRLYGYLEKFDDFYPDVNGFLRKKITLKVSDYRSAIIQGKFLAKKGLWVSEYRIESGLNCGGHLFATDGFLMGPILEEFKNKRDELINTTHEIYIGALRNKNRYYPSSPFNIKITAQGGIGTSKEQDFLLNYYQLDSVGWGTPFLLVPEVVNIDEKTLKQLSEAKEDDFYLSNSSPLGVPFNSLRNSGKDVERVNRMESGKPGSPCPKKFLEFNKDFTDKPICTASISYFKKLDTIKDNSELRDKYNADLLNANDKNCLCEGLSASTLLVKGITDTKQSLAVAICPGPNLAYFSKVAT